MKSPTRDIIKTIYPIVGAINYQLNRLISKLIPARIGISLDQVEEIMRNPKISIKCNNSLEVIVTSGNRLEDLKVFMPSIVEKLNQSTTLAVSVYADQEQSADFLEKNYQDLISSRTLRVISTPAVKFNKANAVNAAAVSSKADLVFLLDSDLVVTNENTFKLCLLHFTMNKFSLISYGYWGQQMIYKSELIRLGGLSSELQNHDNEFTNGVYGDDMDLIIRVVASGGRFQFISQKVTYVFKSLFIGLAVFLVKANKTEFNFFVHRKEVSAKERPAGDYENSLYFKRVGKYTPRKDEALIRYHAWYKFFRE